MYVKKTADIELQEVAAGQKTYRQVLISSDQGPNFALRRFIIEPGGSMPKHTNSVEHEQFVLKGRAQIGIGDQIFEVSQNDVVYIPAHIPHWYKTVGDEPFEFLCSVPNKPDKIELV
jgi:quercetin dioxygenase-like cupin family protein